MKDEEIAKALQQVWDDKNCCELVLTREDLKNLIECLMDVFEQHTLTGSRHPISLQFLAFKNVNSAFIEEIKTNRLHTLYKFSLTGLANNCKVTSSEEINQEILDFETKLGDILEAIAQG